MLPTDTERREGPRRTAHGRRAQDEGSMSTEDLRALIAAHQDARVREDKLRGELDAQRDRRLDSLEAFRQRLLPLVGVATVIGAVVGGVVTYWLTRGAP